jgi:hypothetical protein
MVALGIHFFGTDVKKGLYQILVNNQRTDGNCTDLLEPFLRQCALKDIKIKN